MPTNKVATQIRLDEELYEKLKEIAEKEKRSLNSQMEYFLQISADSYKPKRKKKLL